MFRLRALILNTNFIYLLLLLLLYIKLVVSKILSIAIIVATFLLNYINIAFQSTSVRLNLNESLSKH